MSMLYRCAAALAPAALMLACAGGEIRMGDLTGSAHETYTERLRDAGLLTTALGRDWLETATGVLGAPTDVDIPYREERWLDPAAASAVAFRVSLADGQRLVADIEVSGANPSGILVFLDLFLQTDGARAPVLVATADFARWRLEHVAERSGRYVLRIQPELLRGGRVAVTLTARASLLFPLVGGDLAAVRDPFGASRDAGRRDHDGMDLLAARGTPVLAAAAGRVTNAGTERLGGNVVWMRDVTFGRRLYYAHLDRHAVATGAEVRAGDTLGFVGTSGNARGEEPHLHFGVYRPGRGAVDPYFHLFDPPRTTAPFVGDRGLIGRVSRTGPAPVTLRDRPSADGRTAADLPGEVPVDVLGGSGRWYYVRVPDGRRGYVRSGSLRALAPLRSARVTSPAALLMAAAPDAPMMDSLGPGEVVSVLGGFDGFVLVGRRSGRPAWIGASALDGGRVAGNVP